MDKTKEDWFKLQVRIARMVDTANRGCDPAIKKELLSALDDNEHLRSLLFGETLEISDET